MIEYKFRAWDTAYNKMVRLYVAGLWKLFVAFDGRIGGYEDDDRYEDCAIYGDRFTLMQYTGLKDEDAVEIYKGDILRFDNYPDALDAEVVWFEGAFRVKELSNDADVEEYLSEVNEVSKVIGNIFDNPELMEANQ